MPSLASRGCFILAASSLCLVQTSCQPNAGSGALTGAAVGAGIAALATDGKVVEGALIGAAVGAVAGHVMKAKRYQDAGGQPASSYPFATRTNRKGVVRSPYSPYGEIDVTGFRSGEVAIDPHTNKAFRVP